MYIVEKLSAHFPGQILFFHLINNPKLLFNLLHDTIDNAAPDYILPIIKQGISDGSINSPFAKTAQVIDNILNGSMLIPFFHKQAKSERSRQSFSPYCVRW